MGGRMGLTDVFTGVQSTGRKAAVEVELFNEVRVF
jgi:hypothetical protein